MDPTNTRDYCRTQALLPAPPPVYPAVRIACLLAFAALLPILPITALALAAAALLITHACLGRASLRRYGRGLLRLRYLFLAILILYVGLTPGTPLWSALPGISVAGLSEGTRRALVLVDLLAAVFWLTQVTPMPALAGGLLWLLRPLRLIAVDDRRLGLRLALALEYVTEAGRLIDGVRREAGRGLIDAAAAAILRAEELSRSGQGDVAVPTSSAPPLWQWLAPLSLVAFFFAWPR